MTRGFITVATGDYYHYLAINMINSYRYSQAKNMPFSVITDAQGAKVLSQYFDKVIVINEVNAGYINKLQIQDLSPFDETIFIDADTLIVRDISDWWDAFDASGYDVAVWGWNVDINSPRAGKLISKKAAEKYHINRYIGFNGGVYFFKKNDTAKHIFDRAKELLNSYIEDEQHLFNGNKGDEPVMAVSLIEHGVYGVEDPEKKRMYCTPGMKNLKIDILAHKCSFIKYNYWVSPAVMHWGTAETRKPAYQREVKILNMYLENYPRLLCYTAGWTEYIAKTLILTVKNIIRKFA